MVCEPKSRESLHQVRAELTLARALSAASVTSVIRSVLPAVPAQDNAFVVYLAVAQSWA
jgi:hypothetical protein